MGVSPTASLMIVGLVSVVSIIILIIGIVIQRIAIEILIERMGS